MYTPVQDGIQKTAYPVSYKEAFPPNDLHELVYCYWELRTLERLEKDFNLHAIPDACVDIMFNEIDADVAGVTGLKTTYRVLNLGPEFHYVGIQFLPGVWQGTPNEVSDNYIGTAYRGRLPLLEVNESMKGLGFENKQQILSKLVRELVANGVIVPNPTVMSILKRLDDINSVAGMARITSLSPRQLQRVLKDVTGFSPHDFLKVVRLQQSFKKDYSLLYTDQAHFIRSFRAITGYTPAQYFSRFDV